MVVEAYQESSGVPFVDWDNARENLGWKQGEHITIIGPTGQGKTTLAMDLMGQRGYPLIIATKPQDSTMEKMKRKGYKVIRTHKDLGKYPRTILWPKLEKPRDKWKQAEEIQLALEHAFIAGKYAILIDELSYVLDELKCAPEIKQIWQQGRSNYLSLVTCVLRPSHIPLLAYDQATYVVMFRDADEVNLKRMGGLGHWNRNEIIEHVGGLNRHEFLILNTRTGEMIRSITKPNGGKKG